MFKCIDNSTMKKLCISFSDGTKKFEQKFIHLIRTVTVEPLIALYFIPHILCVPANEALEFYTACSVDARYNRTVCQAILSRHHENYTEQNNHVQKIISNMYSWQVPVHNLVPIALTLFLGSYSDHHYKRKPFLILPFLGEIIGIVGCIFCSTYKNFWSVTIQGLFRAIVPSLFGGHILLMMGATAYIADVSSFQRRTFRIGVLFIVRSLCSTILNIPGGIVFQYFGYISTFAVGGAIYMLGLCYGLFCIRDNDDDGVTQHKGKAMEGSRFSLRFCVDTFNLLWRRRGEDVKKCLLVYVLCIMFVTTVIGSGEVKLMWLFTQAVYNWTPIVFSYNNTVQNAFSFIGVLILIPLLTNVLKARDSTLLIIAFTDKIVTNMIYIFAESVIGLYVAAVGSICSGIAPVALRSLATKCVSSENVAKCLSLLALFEAVASMVSTPIYNQGIYNHTLDCLPEAFFFLGVVLLGLCVVVTMCIRCYGVDQRFARENENLQNK